MRIHQGEVTSVTPVSGGQGADAYSYVKVRLLDRESESFLDARVGDSFGAAPTVGEVIDSVVQVNLYEPRQGPPRITSQLARRVSRPVASVPSTGTSGR